MVGGQNRFSGNILLYDYLSSKRAPIFLDRNLSRALRIHRHLVEDGSTEEFAGDDHSLRSDWQPPSWDALDKMMEQAKAKGSFVLELHSIKPLITESTTPNHEHPGPARKARIVLLAKSTIQVTVYRQSSDLPSLSRAYQNATLQGIEKERCRIVLVETEQIVIRPDEISDDFRSIGSHGAYKLHLSINLNTRKDADEIYDHLALNSTSAPVSSTRLSAQWGNILQCPEGRIVLPLKDQLKNAFFGIEVTMYWNSLESQSIFAAHNRQLRAMTQPTSYPTPPVAADLRSAFELTFVYANETIKRSGLICPHCHRRKASSIDDLRMHLDSWHDYFKYRATKDGLNDEGIERWRFECEVSDHKADQRASAKADEPFDVHVVPPQDPFDRRRYLDQGNDDYQRISRLEKRQTSSKAAMAAPMIIPAPLKPKPPDQVQAMRLREKTRYPVPEAPPGITFFRSCSKRPLQTGESISESDEEVDEDWIERRKSAEYDKDRQLPDNLKRFLKTFDAFVRHEQLRSDIHVGDALIRFAREKCTWLWQESLFGLFKDKVDELLDDKIISKEVHAGCLDIVKSQKPNVDEARGAIDLSQQLAQLDVTPKQMAFPQADNQMGRGTHQDRSSRGKGKAKVTDTGHLTPITADSDGDVEMREATLNSEPDIRADRDTENNAVLSYDLCLCGEDAQASNRKSPLIACSDMDCIRRQFHFECIQKQWGITQDVRAFRKQHWKCEDCKSRSETVNQLSFGEVLQTTKHPI